MRDRSVAAVRRVAGRLAGPEHELPAARMVVAWANGFVTMELAGAFQLGGDVDEAWEFGLDGLVRALARSLAEDGRSAEVDQQVVVRVVGGRLVPRPRRGVSSGPARGRSRTSARKQRVT